MHVVVVVLKSFHRCCKCKMQILVTVLILVGSNLKLHVTLFSVEMHLVIGRPPSSVVGVVSYVYPGLSSYKNLSYWASEKLHILCCYLVPIVQYLFQFMCCFGGGKMIHSKVLLGSNFFTDNRVLELLRLSDSSLHFYGPILGSTERFDLKQFRVTW